MDIKSKIIDAVSIGDVTTLEELLRGEDVKDAVSIDVKTEWNMKYWFFRKRSAIIDSRGPYIIDRMTCPKICGSLLTLACDLGHVDMAKYLIENCQMDIDKSDIIDAVKLIDGFTPLWYAISNNNLKMVKFLVRNGADLCIKSMFTTSMGNRLTKEYQNNELRRTFHDYYICFKALEIDGLTPLLFAAIEGHKDIVMYLTAVRGLVTQQEKIDALEMLGVYFFYDDNMAETAECWKQGLVYRYEHYDKNIIRKPHRSPDKTFNDNQEFSNINDIEKFKFDRFKMCCQTVLICERVLGPTHPITLAYIKYLGNIYFSRLRYDDYINLWIYIRNIQGNLSTKTSIAHVLTFIQNYVHINDSYYEDIAQLDYCVLIKFLKQYVLEIKRLKYAYDKSKYEARHIQVFMSESLELEIMGNILLKTLQIIVLILKELPKSDTVECRNFYQTICVLAKMDPRGYECASLLHICNDAYEYYYEENNDDHFAKMDISYPKLTELLLEAGCNPNATTVCGNTILHNLVSYPNLHPTYLEKVKLLLEAGAHLDAENKGEIFQSLLNNNIVFNSLLPLKYTTLMCLAARTINEYNIDFNDVSKTLHKFILQHKYSMSTYKFLHKYYKK